jgi:hypothetical protein
MKRLLLSVIILLSIVTPAFSAAPPPLVSHQRLNKILGLPGYHRWQNPPGFRKARDNPISRSLDRIYRSLHSWLHNFFKWLRGPKHKHHKHHATRYHGHVHGARGSVSLLTGTTGWILLVVLGLVAAALIAWVFWHLIRQRRAPGSAATASPPPVDVKKALAEGDALAQTSDAWMNLASELGRGGDWRLAYRAMYLALLASLHQSGRINFRKSMTNRMYVLRYRGPTDERDIFSGLTELFDRVWYGHKPVPEEVRSRVDSQMKSLLHLQVPHA